MSIGVTDAGIRAGGLNSSRGLGADGRAVVRVVADPKVPAGIQGEPGGGDLARTLHSSMGPEGVQGSIEIDHLRGRYSGTRHGRVLRSRPRHWCREAQGLEV